MPDSVHLTSDSVTPESLSKVRDLTEDEVLSAIQSCGRELYGLIALTYESGPYDIDKPTFVALRFASAVQRKFREVNASAITKHGV